MLPTCNCEKYSYSAGEGPFEDGDVFVYDNSATCYSGVGEGKKCVFRTEAAVTKAPTSTTVTDITTTIKIATTTAATTTTATTTTTTIPPTTTTTTPTREQQLKLQCLLAQCNATLIIRYNHVIKKISDESSRVSERSRLFLYIFFITTMIRCTVCTQLSQREQQRCGRILLAIFIFVCKVYPISLWVQAGVLHGCSLQRFAPGTKPFLLKKLLENMSRCPAGAQTRPPLFHVNIQTKSFDASTAPSVVVT